MWIRLVAAALALAVALPADAIPRTRRGRGFGGGPRCTSYPETTNWALQSGTFSTGSAATAPWALFNGTVTTAGASDGFAQWAIVADTAGGGIYYQLPSSMPTGGAKASGSSWVKTASGTASPKVQVQCGGLAPTACTCWRSDGGACSANTSANYCIATGTSIGTTAVRLGAVVTCPTEVDQIFLVAGAGSTVRFTGAQLEVNTAPSPYIATVAATVTRPAACL